MQMVELFSSLLFTSEVSEIYVHEAGTPTEISVIRNPASSIGKFDAKITTKKFGLLYRSETGNMLMNRAVNMLKHFNFSTILT